jgi:hypothetical protein
MSTATELFNYNRENFKFNKELRQKRLHMEQNMRIRQVLLFRQDLKDLFELTIGKMDSYIMVNVLLLGITAEMYFKGRAPLDVPSWLFWFWGISLAGSFFFILYSTWLALHASVHAQTYMARCLTQWLRLPVPSIEEINSASARLEEYEKSSLLDFVRPPVVVPEADKDGKLMTNLQKDLSTHWNEFSDHFTLFNTLHTKWQSHEAYARVSMCFGTNMLLSAFSYFALAYYTIDYEDPWIGSLLVVLSTLAQIIHLRMSLSLSEREHYLQLVLVLVPPVCVAIAAALSSSVDAVTGTVRVPTSAVVLACVACLFQFAWILFFMYQTNHDDDGLPMKFSTVWCLEIVGQGIETIRDIEEPRVDFPGFIQPTSDPTDRPLNTYDVSHTNAMSAMKKSAADSTSVPDDVAASCKALEAKLQRLFAYWAHQTHDLTDQELAHIEELKAEFDADSALLAKSMRSSRRRQNSSLRASGIVTGATEASPEEVIGNWVRLTYESDDGINAPYSINPETGEIRWEDAGQDTLRMEINRGLSLIPEQLEKYHETVRKVEYSSRRDKALQRRDKLKPPKWPWELFRSGAVVILLAWIGALIETVLDKLGYEPAFTPLVS